MPVSIVFNQIAVNTVNVNSSVATGQNNQTDWSFQGKNNLAAGQQIGLVTLTGNFNQIVDNDVIDVPVNASEAVNPQSNVQY
ncbi:hypothetical protein [Gracilibacillus sp. YIM 98692]|uniref:hypothetical protein n=1 Tax=Gracilibacillus sp. YIM 98692 TaxID=2663532 RepID=UPI0013D337C2|nr:hypothetical protein [Gracilibacillus sp. YIM 98692]